MRKNRAFALAAGLGLSAMIVQCNESEARADEPPSPPPQHHFGDRGDVVFPLLGGSIDLGGTSAYVSAFGFSRYSGASGAANITTTMVSFAPSADFFVARHFSLGGTVSANYSRYTYPAEPAQNMLGSSSGTIHVGIAPRVGFVAPLGEHTALWPRLQIGVGATDTVGDYDGYVVNPFSFTATVDMPFVYAVDRHFYASIAPFVEGTWLPKAGGVSAGTGLALGSHVEVGFVF